LNSKGKSRSAPPSLEVWRRASSRPSSFAFQDANCPLRKEKSHRKQSLVYPKCSRVLFVFCEDREWIAQLISFRTTLTLRTISSQGRMASRLANVLDTRQVLHGVSLPLEIQAHRSEITLLCNAFDHRRQLREHTRSVEKRLVDFARAGAVAALTSFL
jgi:hypothetical protein